MKPGAVVGKESGVHVSGLDSVRGLAALSVVLAHVANPVLPDVLRLTPLVGTGLPEYAKYLFTGHPAVIAFFVVSGFCIHYPYINKPLPILPFWVARLIRIMIPAVVGIGFAMLGKLRGYNFWDGYILWSIVCELFYYLFYPAFLWASRWIGWRVQFYFSLAVSFSIVVLLGTDQYGNAHIYGPFLNWLVGLPSWLAGCSLAEIVSERKKMPQPRFSMLLIWRMFVASTASILLWLTLNTSVGFYISMNGFALLACLWIKAEIAASPRSDSLLEKTGKWSYSM